MYAVPVVHRQGKIIVKRDYWHQDQMRKYIVFSTKAQCMKLAVGHPDTNTPFV